MLGALMLLAGGVLANYGDLRLPSSYCAAPSPDSIEVIRRTLPARKRLPAVARPGASTAPQSYLDNPLAYLSSAPADSLMLLPGIGPVIAERIVGARSGKRLFTRWEDLLIIRGIGSKKLQRLRTFALENS